MTVRLQYGGYEERKVECFDFETKERINIYPSLAKASAMVGVSTGSITSSCRSKPNRRKGNMSKKFKKLVYFQYKEEHEKASK